MTQKQKNVEMIGIYIVLGLIAFGFVAMLVALARSPRMDESEVTEAVDAPVERSRESVRTYNKPLSIHAFGFATDPMEAPESNDQHKHLVPDAPTSDRSDAMMSEAFSPPPAQPMRKPGAEKDFLADDEEDKLGSGWGWLADDIMSTRNPKDDRFRSNTRAETNQDVPDAEERDAQEESARTRDADSDPSRFDVNATVSGSSDRDPLMKPLRDLAADRSGQPADSRSSDSEESQQDERDVQREGDRSAGLVMRDPFARDASSDRPVFGSRDWSFGGDEESAMRSRTEREQDPRETARERSGSIGSIAPQFDDRSGRLIGDAASDASRLSAGWSGYSSDSIFTGGGGYTPRGVGTRGSDSLFSGSDVFGGSAVFSGISAMDSTAGGITPIGGSSIGSLPTSGGSSLNSSGLGGDRPNPSALPW
jgi:hypothetical protein